MIPISIIIPMYNVEKYITECLESLLKQTVELEIILVDDGSQDNTYAIAEEYTLKHNNIHLFHQENSGQSAARNKGLASASGEYVFFCDSDDFIDENSLSDLYALCKKNDLDYIKTGWKTIEKNDECARMNLPAKYSIIDKVITSKEYFINSIGNWYNVIPWTGLFKRDFLIRNDLRFPEGIQFEDNTFHLKTCLSELSAHMMQVNLPFYNVRIRPESTTSSVPSPKKMYDQLKNVELMNDFIEKNFSDYALKEKAKIAVSSLVFTMTSYYYRIDKKYRKEVSNKIPRKILKDAINHPQTSFQKLKLIAFTYCRGLLNLYEKIVRGH